METKDIINVAIALGGWIFALYQMQVNNRAKEREERATQKQRKLDKVADHINAYAQLAELYRFYARRHDYLVRNSDGSLKVDASGNYVLQQEVAKPEEQFDTAITSLLGTDLKGAIAQKLVQLRQMNGEIGDILYGIDPTGALGKQMSLLFVETQRIEFWIKHENVEQMIAALNNVTHLRREFRRAVEKKLQQT